MRCQVLNQDFWWYMSQWASRIQEWLPSRLPVSHPAPHSLGEPKSSFHPFRYWGIPSFWAPSHPRRGCRGRKPRLPFGFVPRPNKARKVFLFWEKQFIMDSCFLPHLGRWDNLNAVLSALTLEFLAAKLKKKKKKPQKRKPSISIPKRTRLFLETFISLVAVLVSYSVTGWWENQL